MADARAEAMTKSGGDNDTALTNKINARARSAPLARRAANRPGQPRSTSRRERPALSTQKLVER
jgi:hypothetical protein